MTPDLEDDQTLRRYFLGELPRHKHRLIEKSFFEDDGLLDHLLSTEEQLIADYVRGALPERERLRFESYFLTTPQRQQRVKELTDAEGMKVVVPPATSQPVPAPSGGLLSLLKRLWAWLRNSGPMLQIAFAVITLALLGAVWAAFVRSSRQPSPHGQAVNLPGAPSPDVAKVQTPRPPDANTPQTTATPSPEPSLHSSPPVKSATPPRPPAPRENATPPSPTGAVVAAILSPGLMRGGNQVPSVKIMPDTPTVLLRATLSEKEFDLYSATLLNEKRQRVRQWGARAAQGEGGMAVVFNIPAKGLADGYYYLILSGVGPRGAAVKVDTYPFQVEHR